MGKLDDVEFNVITEDGEFRLPMRDIRKDDQLCGLIGRQGRPPRGRVTLFLGRNIITFPEALVLSDKRRASVLEEAERLYRENPLKYFVPQSDAVVEFLNWRAADLSNTMKVLHAGVGTGKSTAAWVDVLLQIIPCDPNWPIFRDFGVKFRPYRGPYVDGGVAIVSYQTQNLEDAIWQQVILRWTPLEHIRPYLDGVRKISWNRNPRAEIAGTPIFFRSSAQKDTAFVSQALDIIWWDEQSSEDKFLNACDRVRRRGGRHVMSLTPHCVAGVADTGAGSWLDRVRRGEMDTGLDVRFFRQSVEDVTPWVVTPGDRKRLYTLWIEDPKRVGDKKRLLQGLSMVHGEFHQPSGRVVDNWDPDIHWIEPFDIPPNWTFYRYHDHGRRDPNACILVAVSPDNDYFVVGEWYARDLEVRDNVRGIVEQLSGNQIAIDAYGRKYEKIVKTPVVYTKSDRGSIERVQDNSRKTLRDIYADEGLILTPGTKQSPVELVPVLTDLFRPRNDRLHYITQTPGAPKIYVFNWCHNLRKEIENWRMKRVRDHAAGGFSVSEKPDDKNDHLMRCLLELAADQPICLGKNLGVDNRKYLWQHGIQKDPNRDDLTGY